ncbi:MULTISPECIES: hypothetical protein [Marinobacter]|uniref:Uncharacterized protein n=1 Tax=Marinobacter alkaliphilus TaxID=254719 RepID=A0ABZ3E6R1_9GAMM|nr:hypothetical protein [Marinobacter nauticus]MBY6102303.1 hypothetical protein [Marinobacter nauticus]
MTRKNQKTEPAEIEDSAKAEHAEPAKQKAPVSAGKAGAKTTAGYVEATLKARHCSGGVCKDKGEKLRMTRGEYERLKKYGRVE